MHPYSTYAARWKPVGVIMLVAVGITTFLESNIDVLLAWLPLSHVPGVPTFTVFTGLYLLFAKYAWKWPLIEKVTAPPNLNGRWKGDLNTSFDGEQPPTPASDGGNIDTPYLSISQTWTRIEINAYFAASVSESTSATIMTNKSFPEVLFTYISKPKGEAATEISIHEGTNELRFTHDEEGNEVLEGTYYTDEQRNNHGEMYFVRDSEK